MIDLKVYAEPPDFCSVKTRGSAPVPPATFLITILVWGITAWAGGLHETGKLFCERMASGQKEPTLLHVEIKLLPRGIGSLIGVPTALIGMQVAFADVVAEPLERTPETSKA